MSARPPLPDVPVQVPIRVDRYARLAQIAQGRGHDTVAEYLASLVDLLVETRPAANTLEVMALQGYRDAEIAKHLDQTNAYVATRRRRLGIPANRPGKAA
jgi:hypothetical protein